ncbi:BTB/POZ and TAZ domain-containing protein 2-like [Hordeum vulgare subsp. vulgare]|uniref:BTB/POZ and TAZ domain-containing protein 2-like n=1 Tax=Hordeum vulgare subsp. vulgare TaxID=112509 RepID=UPI00162DD301|nr:BTB/POZ and TAZ domain-containing protein 2-like [Hordeum vulgare subsp. vulgare]
MPEAPARAAADVDVVTSSGRRKVAAHSSVLASASPVLETILERRLQRLRESGKGGRAVVRIRGVTDDVAAAFVRLLYAGGRRGEGEGDCEVEEDVEKYAEQLLVLAHAYRVPWLKLWCQEAIGSRLTPGTVVDALQLADLCDAPQLHLRCMRLLAKEFRAVERTEAWRFLRDNDPWQELDVLSRLHDADMRRRKWRRKSAEQKVYMELSDAMDILRHICTEGCTEVGPVGQAPAKSPCPSYATCRGLQLLIRHFSRCKSRATCPRCQRMWQLLRLHSALCRLPDGHCNTPLCAQFKLKEQQKDSVSTSVSAKAGDGGYGRWGLLVKKVKAVSVMSSLGKRSPPPCQC